LHTLGLATPDQAATLNSRMDELVRRLDPWSTGRQNVNYLTAADTTVEGVQRAYDFDTYRRLTTIKRAYDPDNTFRINFNINPA
jgi:FAD/FMN-containing dehydrogenase